MNIVQCVVHDECVSNTLLSWCALNDTFDSNFNAMFILLTVKFSYISKWNDISNKNHTKNSTADTCVTTLVGIYI